jgi:hypothetical protein
LVLRIPDVVLDKYVAYLGTKKVPLARFAEYKKWLRYYLDFCYKNPVTGNMAERVRMFREKPKKKKQTEKQRQRISVSPRPVFRAPSAEAFLSQTALL